MDFTTYCSYFDIPDLEVTKIGKKYYVLSDEQKQLNTKTDKEMFYGGTYLGEDKGKHFHMSVMFLDLAFRHSHKKVVIKDSIVFLFLCGRDIMGRGLKGTYDFRKGDLVLVCNTHGDCLGIGEVVGDLSLMEKVVIKNIFDRGDLLRREKKR